MERGGQDLELLVALGCQEQQHPPTRGCPTPASSQEHPVAAACPGPPAQGAGWKRCAKNNNNNNNNAELQSTAAQLKKNERFYY